MAFLFMALHRGAIDTSPQASTNGSDGLYKDHEGNVLTTMHDEHALKHLLENLPDEKLVALGKLAVVDGPTSPATTPISIDQTQQAPSPSISERHLQDENEENRGMGICQEMATPSDSLSTGGYEHDSLPTDEPHTHVSSQEGASPDSSVPGTPNPTDTNEGSLASPSLVQEGGMEHDVHPHVPVLEETANPAEAGDGAVQHSTNTPLDVAQAVYAKEPPQTREEVSSPSNLRTPTKCLRWKMSDIHRLAVWFPSDGGGLLGSSAKEGKNTWPPMDGAGSPLRCCSTTLSYHNVLL
ncbi:hypothetical protein V496_02430 [Pseudogymnoascus sp. VKM F-4515 (FW-2607)]|nr:hypothetical protein V496_02430 [Pseudogymnoascus sp. VKM F-4515 (FW-2607)]